MPLILTSLDKALASLKAALALPKDDIVRDSVIKRFEYTYELAWKMMQRWLKENVGAEQIDLLTRKDLFRVAAKKQLIPSPLPWFDYHQSRNQTAHAYDADKAEQVYQVAVQFVPDAEHLLRELQQRND